MVVIQIIAVQLWRRVINRRFYRFHHRRDAAAESSGSTHTKDMSESDLAKGPSFMGFPKTLVSVRLLDEVVPCCHTAFGHVRNATRLHQVWPNTLFYTISCFCPGLVRTATTVLVANPGRMSSWEEDLNVHRAS